MGANWVVKRFTEQDEDALREAFKREQEEDRYMNGHSYSGGFGMADGLEIRRESFASEEQAEEFLEQHARKWEAAIAVWVIQPGNESYWLVGALCSS